MIIFGALNLMKVNSPLKEGEERGFMTKSLMWTNAVLGIGLGILSVFFLFQFAITNANHEYSYQKAGLYNIMYLAIITSITSLLFWYKTRKIWPEMVIGLISIIQVVIILMLTIYFAR